MPGTDRRFSFILKLVVVALLTAAADFLFYGKAPGSTLGLFALAWIAAIAIAVPATRRKGASRIALLLAIAPALVLADDPGWIDWILFWGALSSATLLARQDFHDAAQHLLRLFLQAVTGWFAPVRDALRLLRVPRPHLRGSLLATAAALIVPLAGGAVFIALFAKANPLVEQLIPTLTFPDIDLVNTGFILLLFAGLWPAFRPVRISVRTPLGTGKPVVLPGVTVLSVLLSLVLFNAIFAVENGLDIAFLWSGAALPHGVTMAEYAHRGAYPLIVTALLAGAFVLVTTHPDTAMGRHPLVRRLVVAWTVQNLILVASSVLRTIDYINAYMLTELRIAALVWMGLVGICLVLICCRMVWRRSLCWLINRIAATAVIVLFCSSLVDFGAVAADWNVAHAREAGGSGQPLDLGYLHSLGPSAMVALAQLENRPQLRDAFRDQVAYVREQSAAETVEHQKKPYGWTWRNARRLDSVRAILGPHPRMSRKTACGRDWWDGAPSQCPTLTAPVKP